MRLDRLLALKGMTRTEARRAIAAGRVRLRGETVRDAGLHAEAGDVSLDGAPLCVDAELHLMLHKPAGVVTAREDGRFETVFDLLPEKFRRKGLAAVGRLDRDVTGLLLFTTDGQLAHRLISPKWTVEKVYRAEVEGTPDSADLRKFSEGLALDDFVARPAVLRVLRPGETALAELTVTEGKFHQVKRMFAAVGHPVKALARIRVGGVLLDPSLAPGEARLLTPAEIDCLYALTRLERKA